MTVATIDDVATELGIATPDLSGAQGRQWQSWLDRVELQIELRLGDVSQLDQRVVRDVEVMAVAAKVRQPDPVSTRSRQVSVDDGSVQETSTYQRSTGLVEILDEWWEWLSPDDGGAAFSIEPEHSYRAPGSEYRRWL